MDRFNGTHSHGAASARACAGNEGTGPPGGKEAQSNGAVRTHLPSRTVPDNWR